MSTPAIGTLPLPLTQAAWDAYCNTNSGKECLICQEQLNWGQDTSQATIQGQKTAKRIDCEKASNGPIST
ncbi:hypothetical protein VKT23_019604 [Stygiomarasmius scandens]|uniref:Uncharacterized protein n=1 Tax=Marasmiellus scandens TaxID=2682957 RepID=A0ABR1IPZ9_9AGAR